MRFISLKLILALFTICLFQINCISQEKATISGYITDGKSGEEMIGIKIYIPSIKKGQLPMPMDFIQSRFLKELILLSIVLLFIQQKKNYCH